MLIVYNPIVVKNFKGLKKKKFGVRNKDAKFNLREKNSFLGLNREPLGNRIVTINRLQMTFIALSLAETFGHTDYWRHKTVKHHY